MATAVYGGSPRHHQNRMLVTTPSGSSPALQPQQHHHHHQMNPNKPPNIIIPPSPYLSSPSSLQHYHHNPQQYGSQQHFGHSSNHNFYQTAQLHHSPHLPNPIYASHRNFKRKSAVELLAETKAYYVKSETVLDRHQQLYRSSNLAPTSCKYRSLQQRLYHSSFALSPHAWPAG